MNEKNNQVHETVAGTVQTPFWESGLLLASQPSQKLQAPYQQLLDAAEFEKLENLLMERLDAVPGDIDFFIPAYRAFVKRLQSERALAVLQLHLDCLRDRGDLFAEIKLLSLVLEFWPDCGLARKGLLFHLRSLYAQSPSFDRLAKQFKVFDLGADLDTLRQFELWLRYDEGQAIYMPQKGLGRVKEVNFTLGVIRASFEGKEQISLKIDEAQRLMQSLSKDHFLSQKLGHPETLKAMAEADPGELLRLLFASVRRPLVLSELRDMLSGIIAEAAWSTWWGRARKDNRLMIGGGTKPQVSWSESAADAAVAIGARFIRSSPYEKMEMMQKHAGRSTDLAADMLQSIVKDANEALSSNPALALEIALTLEKIPLAKGLEFSFTPAGVLARVEAAEIISGVKDRLVRRKAVQLLAEARDDWPEVYVKLLRTETDAQSLAIMYGMLREKAGMGLLQQVLEHTFSDPPTAPRFYMWLCSELPKCAELKEYANWAFLQSLLRILDNSMFKGHHANLRKLFDLGEAVDYAVSTIDVECAGRLLEALAREGTLEDYRKERLRQEIYQRYPQLHEKKEHVFYVTAEALEKKRVEFEQLIRVDIPRNSREIQRTREYGDLRENFEYHAARARQEMLSSRAKTLHDQLGFSRIIVFENVDVSKISIGTNIFLRGLDNKEELINLSILGPWDSDPAKNILSYTSAAGAALLSSSLGAEVIYGEKKYTVEKIDVWKKE
jgi:transcription elongation GreA/GreB family factor